MCSAPHSQMPRDQQLPQSEATSDKVAVAVVAVVLVASGSHQNRVVSEPGSCSLRENANAAGRQESSGGNVEEMCSPQTVGTLDEKSKKGGELLFYIVPKAGSPPPHDGRPGSSLSFSVSFSFSLSLVFPFPVASLVRHLSLLSTQSESFDALRTI
jgi:hypothetical protein